MCYIKQHETLNVVYFIMFCKSISHEPQKSTKQIFIHRTYLNEGKYYFQLLLNDLHLGLYYPLKNTIIVIFGEKRTENEGSLFNVELIEGQSNMADGGSVALSETFAVRFESGCCLALIGFASELSRGYKSSI